MRSSLLSHKQAAILLSFLLWSSINALPSNLGSRADPADSCLNDETPTLDGPTSDRSAGIGVEFEAASITLSKPDCSLSDTNQAKGQLLGNRQGTNWKLTADTTSNIAGRLNAEYILDGTQIKIGTGVASAAAAAVSNDLIAWNPAADMENNQFDIDGNACNPWEVSSPSRVGSPGLIFWAVQVTAPLPLEAIGDLFAAALTPPVISPLLPGIRPNKNKVSVTPKFFQSNPNGISSESVKPDVLGFFCLVVSYAKAAPNQETPRYEDGSPKTATSIMPRTEFVTLYAQVKATLPGTGTLYDLVKVLACYRNVDDDDVEIDSAFCDGDVSSPKPNSNMDNLGWCLQNESGQRDCLLVKDWIASIEGGQSPDKLTTLDKIVDGQIGGLGTALENVVGTTRGVPLFEFRDLSGIQAPRMEPFVTGAENAILSFHDRYKAPPQRKKSRRDIGSSYGKRQIAADCSITSPPTLTPTPTPAPSCSLQNEDPDQGINARGCVCGSTTLPLLTLTSVTDDAQSCSYTAIPTSGVPNPITIASTVYTTNCQACTLVGGIADTPTCTAIEGCTPTPTSSTPLPAPPTITPPPPTCSPGFYGTDTSCGDKCNGPKAKCECIEAGYLVFNNACTCTC